MRDEVEAVRARGCLRRNDVNSLHNNIYLYPYQYLSISISISISILISISISADVTITTCISIACRGETANTHRFVHVAPAHISSPPIN